MPRPGPWMTLDGWLPASWGNKWNYWQHGYNPISGVGSSAMVEACISRYAQAVAMCPGSHWVEERDGDGPLAYKGRRRVTNSALNRIIRRPNWYQSISDFLLAGTRGLYSEGNWYALALRNDRNDIDSLHLMDPRNCRVSAITVEGDLFYQLGGNPVVDRLGLELNYVPARDVLHVRINPSRDMLRGESPLVAAAINLATSNQIFAQQFAYYMNEARPSFILTTDQALTAEQAQALRAAWEEQAAGISTGRTPMMAYGIKPEKIQNSASDGQLVEMLKMSDQAIAEAFGVPLQILGIGGAPLGSTEALMSSWLATSLGFTLNHIEEAFGLLFKLKGQPDEYLEFDTRALLRTAYKDRMEGLAAGVRAAILAPNEAREEDSRAAVPYGDVPRVQQQDVPLDWHAQQQAREEAAAAEPPAPANDDDAEPAEAAARFDLSALTRSFEHGRQSA